MKIVIAKTAGFCMGVRRAVEMALDAPGQYEKPIHTYGPLIHNPQVLELFAEKGVSVLDRIPAQGSGTILVRAHGVPPDTKQSLKQAGFTVKDATCPRVVKVQSIIKSHARKGYAVIIAGDQNHPEIIGLLGFAGPTAYVVGSMEQMKALPDFDRAIVVAQTTQNQELYSRIKAWVEEKHPTYKVFDTICDSTEKRQVEVRQMARSVDAVIVVGGKNSGNTRRLAEIVFDAGKPAFHVETEAELDTEQLSQFETIGITAGASTPSWMIKRVLRSVEQLPLKRWQGRRSFILSAQRFLLLTNLYVALGAGCLSYAAMHLQGQAVLPASMAVAVLYVLSMHILNHLTGRAEDKYNDPDREQFYGAHRIPLVVLALIAGTLGLVAAYTMGSMAFWTLLAMSVLGLSYNLRIIPDWLAPGKKFRRIRDLPGSKTILIALAWGVITAALPALASPGASMAGTAVVFIWATGLVLGRTAFFDILDIQGDRIVGKETIPVLIGQKRSFKMLKVLLIVLMLLPLGAGAFGLLRPLAYLLAVCPFFLAMIVAANEKGEMPPGMRLEFRVESLFVFSGLLAFIYTLF